MSPQFIVRSRFAFRFLFLLVACKAVVLTLAGQSTPLRSVRDTAIEAHFAAAQGAQHNQDYATAEQEYRSVLAIEPGFAEVHMNLGLVYQLQNRSSEAISEFQRALKLNPRLAGANFFLGVDYCMAGEDLKAIPYLKAALKAEPTRTDIWLWLARAQEMSGQFQTEVTTLLHALEREPKDADLLYVLGNAYERLGKRQAEHLGKVAPGSARSEQLLAESYAASSEWPSAVIHFQNALAAAPQRDGLHVELGEVLLRAGKANQAILEFDEELRRDPTSLRALTRRGEARLIQGNLDAALQDWENAIALDQNQAERILGIRETGFGDAALEQLPDDVRERIQKLGPELGKRDSPASHLAQAFLSEQSGNLSQTAAEGPATSGAKKKAANCAEADPTTAWPSGRIAEFEPCLDRVLTQRTSAEIRIRAASALLEAGQYQSALNALDGLPIADRNSAEASYWRARCYEKLATAAYLRLYQADPNSYRVHQLMGDLEATKGDDAKAIDEYRAAIAIKSSLPNLHYSLGHVLWKDLKVTEARAELDMELSLNPRHPGALNDMGDTYLLEHQPDKALPYLLKALAADSTNLDIHRDLGTAYSELHDYRKAEEQYKIAVAADHDGSVHYKLARVYHALGEKENAAREFALSSAMNRESHDRLEKQTERVGEVTRSAENF